MNEDNNMIPVSFSDAKIGKELDNAHCLQASSLQKEGITQKQEMTRIVCPVLTPDRAEKRQNGRRFKDDGEPSYTLTAQDIHGVAIGVNIRDNEIQGAADEAHCLNANDQRKVFGAQQERTIVAMKVREATKQGYAYAHEGDSINLSMPDSKTRRGRIGGGSGTDIRHELQSGNNGSDKGEYP